LSVACDDIVAQVDCPNPPLRIAASFKAIVALVDCFIKLYPLRAYLQMPLCIGRCCRSFPRILAFVAVVVVVIVSAIVAVVIVVGVAVFVAVVVRVVVVVAVVVVVVVVVAVAVVVAVTVVVAVVGVVMFESQLQLSLRSSLLLVCCCLLSWLSFSFHELY